MYQYLIRFVLHNPWFAIIGAVTIVQIVPIQINPWSTIMNAIRKFLTGRIEKDLDDLKEQLDDVSLELENEKITTMRWNVLDFANSCRNHREHTKEEWDHCLCQLKKYETICENKGISNGVMEEDAKYLRELYHTLNKTNNFL